MDVIPVDMVVAAIIAVAAAGPDPAGPTVYHVASSVRNPLRYGELVDLVRSWFTEHPLYDSDGQPIMVPEWSFPGRGRVQRQLQRATKALDDRRARPGHAAGARRAGRPGGARRGATRPRPSGPSGYTELYGAYTETEAHFRVDRLLTLWDRLSPADQDALLLRPGGDLLGPLRPRRAPAVGGRARPGALHAPTLDGGQPVRPGPRRHPVARAPPGRLRPREHPGGLQRGGVLRLAGEPAPPRRRARQVHGPHPARSAGAARPRPARPGRLPAQLLPPLRRRARRAAAPRRGGDVPPPAAGEVVPGRLRPGARPQGARAPHRPHHRRARLRGRAAAPAVRRGGVRAAGPGRRGPAHGTPRPAPAHR